MINQTQLDAIIDQLSDEGMVVMIDLLTHDDAELRSTLNHPQSLATLATDAECSIGTITRIIQGLLDPEIYFRTALNWEICPIHRCDHQICIDDNLHR
jgi:hypothetical protein